MCECVACAMSALTGLCDGKCVSAGHVFWFIAEKKHDVANNSITRHTAAYRECIVEAYIANGMEVKSIYSMVNWDASRFSTHHNIIENATIKTKH